MPGKLGMSLQGALLVTRIAFGERPYFWGYLNPGPKILNLLALSACSALPTLVFREQRWP